MAGRTQREHSDDTADRQRYLDAALESRLRRDEERIASDEARLRRDEERLGADEERLAEDEKALRANRLTAAIAVALAGTLALAVAGVIIGLFALNRDIETVAKAAPKDSSVGTTALKDGAVAAAKLAPGSVTAEAIAAGAVVREDLAAGVVGRRQLGAGSVSGAKVAHDSLGGAQINERTLARVPTARSASRADTAHDTRALAGLGATAYVSGVRLMRVASSTSHKRTKGPLAARCPAGMRVIAGGAEVDGASRGVAIVRSAPAGREWVGAADTYRSGGAPWRLVVTAICAAGGR